MSITNLQIFGLVMGSIPGINIPAGIIKFFVYLNDEPGLQNRADQASLERVAQSTDQAAQEVLKTGIKASIPNLKWYALLQVIPLVGFIFVLAEAELLKKINFLGEVSSNKTSGDGVESRKRTSIRPQDDSLENISKMTKERMGELCDNLEVNDRNDYIKCMLIFSIKGEKFDGGCLDYTFHETFRYFKGSGGELKGFVHEDIAAGRNNQEDSLLHEILKCKFLSSKAKGQAFGFILRDGHDHLRDYLGERTLGEMNEWGNQPVYFRVVKWGDSLKKIFDTFSIEQQREFFANSDNTADRLKSFTGIEKQ